ncbi:MAG: GAF domain-containing protein [Actinobacteria bacterium]|nr:GAF domain-containing protein [Actinomycetota bacterium]
MSTREARASGGDRTHDSGAGVHREGVRLLLTSTRFIASLFWLTIIVATLVFVLPYSERSESPVFYGFIALSILVFLGHHYFPYEGYHPVAYFMLLLATDALVAVMVYLTGGSESSISLLYLTVIIFSSAYFELLETMLITAITCAVYFLPLAYETVTFEALKGMAMAVPIYFIIALGGFFVISKAREQEREKQTLTLLYDQADTKRRELSTLYAVSLKFASTLDDEEMMDILLDNASYLVPNDAIAVSLLETPELLHVKAYRGLDDRETEMFVAGAENNPLYISASAVLPVILKDPDEDPRFQEFMNGVGFTSLITVPLYASSSVIGVLCCFSRDREAFDDDDARLLLTLSSESALALEKAALYQTTLEDKKKIETIINSLTDGLMVLDQEGRLVLANPFIARLMDLEEEDYDRNLAEIFERSSYTIEFKDLSLEEALEGVLSCGQSAKNEMVIDTEPPIIFQVFWVPLAYVEGKAAGAVILLHDITDFVELDRMKSDFISIVSHELKTPLTSIKGFVRLIAAGRVGPVTGKQRHYLDVVQKQTESLTLLINDLLDLSRIEAGIIEVCRKPLMLSEVIGGVVQQLDNLAHEKHITLRVEMAEDLPMISGDYARLGQVFMNLIHNAIKFTPQGGDIRVKAISTGGHCLVKISDNGIGISAQDLPRIFDKFYQVDSSSTRRQSGTGLGLSISRQLVTAHGGEMWVNSTKGKGTTFSLTLPLHAPQTDSRQHKTNDMGEAAMG